jgi:hypothetical protein
MGINFSDVGYGRTGYAAREACAASIQSRGYNVTYPYKGDSYRMRVDDYGIYGFEMVHTNKTYGAKPAWVSRE